MEAEDELPAGKTLWDFDDGTGSSAAQPTHTYLEPGIYTVRLTVTGPGGSDSDTRTVSVP